jgi:hypothetical protein
MSDADTGTEALRAVLTARIRKGHAAAIARDLDILLRRWTASAAAKRRCHSAC